MQPAMWHGTGLRTSYQEYTLMLCTHTNNNDFLLHTCHVPKPWIRWPSIKALADHATTRWVGGWTGLAVARWCPPNDVSRFLPSLVRNIICLLVSTIYSDISVVLLEEDFGGWTSVAKVGVRQLSEKSKQTSAGFDFLWVTGDLGAGIHSGQARYQWFKRPLWGETTCILI